MRHAGRPNGFTLIEVVIALAIGVCIVLAVIGTVRSLSRAARILETTGTEDEAWLRFAEIFRRDIRGWMPDGGRREPERQDAKRHDKTGKAFFDGRTTADALAGHAQEGDRPTGRMTAVRYLVQREGDEFVIVREEDGEPAGFAVPVLRVKTEPRMESFDGRLWSAGTAGSQRPVALRLTVGLRTLTIPTGQFHGLSGIVEK